MPAWNPVRWLLGGLIVSPVIVAALSLSLSPRGEGVTPGVAVIGPTAEIKEVSSGVEFLARVDTGAAVSSLHCTPDDFVIEDPAEKPQENLNKRVRLRVENRHGEDAWIETTIDDYVQVRNAETSEHRYRVKLPLECGPVRKTAIVNLNDRSTMSFRMLLGRDFLQDSFVVDVARSGPAPHFGAGG